MIRKTLLTLTLMIVSIPAMAAQDFDEGIEYAILPTPVKTSNPDKVVVTEIFWYGCPHCYRFEPYIEKYKASLPKGVVLEQVPSVLNPSWAEHARAYFALKLMGVTDKVHKQIFDAIHLKRMRLNNVDDMAKFVAQYGVDEKKFREMYHSFPVDTMIRKSGQIERKYGHSGVPTVIVNGKYRTSGSMTGSNAKTIEVIDYLVRKELAAKGQ